MTIIGDGAFYSRTGLTNVTSVAMPDSVTDIGRLAFCNCLNLKSITIPHSVTSVDDSAFKNCAGLTSVTISVGITNIERATFQGCARLASVEIPNSVTGIADFAFADCSRLASVTLGVGVKSIGISGFNNCYNLTSVHLNGYSFDTVEWTKAPHHPVHSVTWYDAVKWCNARSEKEGRMPPYYTNAEQTVVYRFGKLNVQNEWVNWRAGYRLPTEAEWEKAARGGLSGKRFPWGDLIAHDQANYYSDSTCPYDVSSTPKYHPVYYIGQQLYTSPVGSFASNEYGLYDMTGNVWQWCWDSYSDIYYASSSTEDPHGGISNNRVVRGGSFFERAPACRVSNRLKRNPLDVIFYNGFRTVLPQNN